MLGSAARSVAIAVALAAVGTFPLLTAPLTRLIGHPEVDVGNHAWGPWWWWISLGRGEIPWRTDWLAAPGGGVLWFIDPFAAMVGAPLVGVVGMVGAYNLAILVALAIAAYGTRELARALGAGKATSWIAGAAAALGPYLLCEVHNGVSEAVGVGWSSLALAAARRERWGTAGIWLGAAACGTWYYGLATGITIGAWALMAGTLRGALLAGAIGVALAAPVLWLVHASIGDPDSLVVRGDVQGAVREFLLAHNAVDPRAFVAPGGFQSVDLAAQGEAFLHSSYVGLAALALALWARQPRVLAGVLPCAVLSLGAYLWCGGWVTVGESRLALPFAWLVKLLPDAGATHAQRLAWPVVATVAALAAVGAERLGRWRVLAGIVVSLDLLVSSPWPLARVEKLDSSAHTELRARARTERAAWTANTDEHDRAQGVLDLPAEVGNTMATSRYLVYQAFSELPIPYRPDARGGTARVFGMPWFTVLFRPSVTRPDQAAALERDLGQAAEVDIGSLERQGGLHWIVLHREFGTADIPVIEAQLVEWFGAGEPFGTHLVFDVGRRRADTGRVLR